LAHRRYLDWLQHRLETLGLTLKRYPVALGRLVGAMVVVCGSPTRGAGRSTSRWRTTGHIPGKQSRPGWTAKLVDVGAGTQQDYAGKDVRGTIVLADFAVTRAKVSSLFPLTDHYEPPDRQQEAGAED